LKRIFFTVCIVLIAAGAVGNLLRFLAVDAEKISNLYLDNAVIRVEVDDGPFLHSTVVGESRSVTLECSGSTYVISLFDTFCGSDLFLASGSLFVNPSDQLYCHRSNSSFSYFGFEKSSFLFSNCPVRLIYDGVTLTCIYDITTHYLPCDDEAAVV
jgi:hypothetical protein